MWKVFLIKHTSNVKTNNVLKNIYIVYRSLLQFKRTPQVKQQCTRGVRGSDRLLLQWRSGPDGALEGAAEGSTAWWRHRIFNVGQKASPGPGRLLGSLGQLGKLLSQRGQHRLLLCDITLQMLRLPLLEKRKWEHLFKNDSNLKNTED